MIDHIHTWNDYNEEGHLCCSNCGLTHNQYLINESNMVRGLKMENEIVLKKDDVVVEIPVVPAKKELRKYWDSEYINKRLSMIRKTEHRMLFTLLWLSGIRITEAIGLTKGRIDFDNYVMTVKWLKSRKYYERVVPLHPNLKDMLYIYTGGMKYDTKLFDMTRQWAWKLCKQYFGGHPHQMRHSFAVKCLRDGMDIYVLHRLLGHSKIQTTLEYLKIVPVDQGKELAKVRFT